MATAPEWLTARPIAHRGLHDAAGGLIENTAGGDNAMARRLERIERLWAAVGQAKGGDTVGFCLDTCHAHAGGEELVGLVDRVKAITGRIDLVHANLKGLPPTTLITDQYDPLMSEGKMLADNLQKAGVPVKYQNYDGVTHEFFGMAAVVPEAKQAQALASGELKSALNK